MGIHFQSINFITRKEFHLLKKNIDILPKEIITYIFSFLSGKDLAAASKVCKKWKALSPSNIPEIVYKQFFKIYPEIHTTPEWASRYAKALRITKNLEDFNVILEKIPVVDFPHLFLKYKNYLLLANTSKIFLLDYERDKVIYWNAPSATISLCMDEHFIITGHRDGGILKISLQGMVEHYHFTHYPVYHLKYEYPYFACQTLHSSIILFDCEKNRKFEIEIGAKFSSPGNNLKSIHIYRGHLTILKLNGEAEVWNASTLTKVQTINNLLKDPSKILHLYCHQNHMISLIEHYLILWKWNEQEECWKMVCNTPFKHKQIVILGMHDLNLKKIYVIYSNGQLMRGVFKLKKNHFEASSIPLELDYKSMGNFRKKIQLEVDKLFILKSNENFIETYRFDGKRNNLDISKKYLKKIQKIKKRFLRM